MHSLQGIRSHCRLGRSNKIKCFIVNVLLPILQNITQQKYFAIIQEGANLSFVGEIQITAEPPISSIPDPRAL